MIRRLIILLLIVGCEDAEEPKGLCILLKGTGDTLTAMSLLDSTFNLDSLFQFECKDGYTINDCCSSGIYTTDTSMPTCSEQEENHNLEDTLVFNVGNTANNCISRGLKICNGSILLFGNPVESSLDGLNPEYWIENKSCSE